MQNRLPRDRLAFLQVGQSCDARGLATEAAEHPRGSQATGQGGGLRQPGAASSQGLGVSHH